MTEPNAADGNTSSDRPAPPDSQSTGRGRSLAALVMAAVAAAAAIVSITLQFQPAPETTGDQPMVGTDQPPNPGVTASTSPPAPALVQPVIALPTVAIPATAEQYQEEAERVAVQLQERFPDRPEALHVLAMLRSQLRQTADAESLWTKCIELDPKHEGYYVNLAAIAMDRGNSQLAADTLEKAIAVGSDSPDVQHHLAIAYTQLGRCEEAVAIIQKALAADSPSGGYWLVLGQAQLKLGQTADAETSLRKAVELGIQTPELYFALGNACARNGKAEEAAEFRKRFAELKSSEPLDVQRRYEILSTAEARRTALTVLLESATVYSWQGDFLQAESLYLRILALDPARPEPCQGLISLYQQAGMLAEEREVRRRLARLAPLDIVNHLTSAKLSAELGEPRTAEASLKLAAAIAPRSPSVQASLAQFYLQTTRAEQARWHAQQAVLLEPSAEGYRFLASTCRLMDDAEAAEAALMEADKLAETNDQRK